MSIKSFLVKRRARKSLQKFMATLKSYLESPAMVSLAPQLAANDQTIDFVALASGLKEATGWKSERPLIIPNDVVRVAGKTFSSLQPVSDALAAAHSDIVQLKFLLASAPMMDAPSKFEGPSWFKRAITPFGYMHPKTMAQYQWIGDKVPNGVVTMPGSNTRWVLTSLMPENRVILSTFPIPGLEKIMTR